MTGFDRPNLKFIVRKPKDKLRFLKAYLEDRQGKSGIIYASTRNRVDKLQRYLAAAGLSVTKYHAGLSEAERKKAQEDFIFDKKDLVVATNAFGMGIDKSNVGFVIHYNMPKDLSLIHIYVVFRFDFSGSGESDGSFYDMTVSREEKEVEMIHDFAKMKYYVDKDRLYWIGHSLGGVLALSLIHI